LPEECRFLVLSRTSYWRLILLLQTVAGGMPRRDLCAVGSTAASAVRVAVGMSLPYGMT
jgi:hypothetical protein